MLKAKRLKSMFVLYSACAVMATGFTSQAASERPEVTTITETKKEDANTHTAVQTISQSIVASAQEMTDASQQVIAENIAKKRRGRTYCKRKGRAGSKGTGGTRSKRSVRKSESGTNGIHHLLRSR